jgi:hypothetical protein
MQSTKLITFLILIGIFNLLINVGFSKTLLEREPSLKKRAFLLAVLWLIPIVGVITVYKILDLGWFKNTEESADAGAVSAGLMEMDAIFNPGARHLIETKQEERVEVQKEGELYKGPDS